jgi:hypothetical protein
MSGRTRLIDFGATISLDELKDRKRASALDVEYFESRFLSSSLFLDHGSDEWKEIKHACDRARHLVTAKAIIDHHDYKTANANAAGTSFDHVVQHMYTRLTFASWHVSCLGLSYMEIPKPNHDNTPPKTTLLISKSSQSPSSSSSSSGHLGGHGYAATITNDAERVRALHDKAEMPFALIYRACWQLHARISNIGRNDSSDAPATEPALQQASISAGASIAIAGNAT